MDKIKKSKQYWDVKNSGKRLFYKLRANEKGEFRAFKPTESDFNSLKSLLGYIDRVESKTIFKNELYAKLYLMHLTQEIRRNETTSFNDEIFSSLSQKLSLPLDLYYRIFYDDLCSNQFNRLTHAKFSDKEGNEIIMDAKRFKETFTFELVRDKLNEIMNKTLHRRS